MNYNPIKSYFFIILDYVLSLLHDIKICLYILLRGELYIEIETDNFQEMDWVRKIYFIYNKNLYMIYIDRDEKYVEVSNVTISKIIISKYEMNKELPNFISKSITGDINLIYPILNKKGLKRYLPELDFHIKSSTSTFKNDINEKSNLYKQIQSEKKKFKLYKNALKDNTVLVYEYLNNVSFYFIYNKQMYELHVNKTCKSIILSYVTIYNLEFATSWRELTYKAIKDLLAFKNYHAILQFMQPMVNTVLENSNISENKIVFITEKLEVLL